MAHVFHTTAINIRALSRFTELTRKHQIVHMSNDSMFVFIWLWSLRSSTFNSVFLFFCFSVILSHRKKNNENRKFFGYTLYVWLMYRISSATHYIQHRTQTIKWKCCVRSLWNISWTLFFHLFTFSENIDACKRKKQQKATATFLSERIQSPFFFLLENIEKLSTRCIFSTVIG